MIPHTPPHFTTRGALPRRFVIYIPAGPRDLQPTADGPVTEAVAIILCKRFGGVTSYPAKGSFTRDSGDIQTESVMVLESYCEPEVWDANRTFMERLAGTLASLLNQESIACSLDGRMELINPDGRELAAFPPGQDAESIGNYLDWLLRGEPTGGNPAQLAGRPFIP